MGGRRRLSERAECWCEADAVWEVVFEVFR